MRKNPLSFPGQGSQYPRMLDGIANRNFYEDLCLQTLNKSLASSQPKKRSNTTLMFRLPFLFAASVGLMTSFKKGIKPSLLAGLSIGAFPAAVIAGALPMQTALK